MSEIVHGNKITYYHQTAQILKRRIQLGHYNTERRLPSLRNLCREFGVSMTVIQRAIHCLEEEGIVDSHHGKHIALVSEDPCEQTAILFGFIHPFTPEQGFNLNVLGYIHQAFAERSNFVIVHSSLNEPNREQAIAEHFINNGIQGLIVWATDNDSNSEYFDKLAKKIPVVLVDRQIVGADLPSVVIDCRDMGRQICSHFFDTMKKKRLLVLMDQLAISPYNEMVEGFYDVVTEMGRMADISVIHLPISRLVQELEKGNTSHIDIYAHKIDSLLLSDEYDCLFTTQNELIEYVFYPYGLKEKYSSIQLARIRLQGPYATIRRYQDTEVLEWIMDPIAMVSKAADMVQRWTITRQRPIPSHVRLKTFLNTSRI